MFSIKNLYVLCFHMYTYYKKTLMVFGFALAQQCLEMVFRPAQNVLNIIIHRLFSLEFLHMILYIDLLFLYKLFSTSRFSKLVSFMFDLVHSLSTWFTYSLISPIFRLSTVPTLLTRCGLL